MLEDTALAPPIQEQSKQKASPLNHGGEPHDDGMRGVLPTGSMQTIWKTQAPFSNSQEMMKNRMKELEAEMKDLHRRMATTSTGDLEDDKFDEESLFQGKFKWNNFHPISKNLA
uniref:Uncharacterized protein n=1 Tax=Cannabis sativa TaxID=3483 RepID=A0A803P218_CANSA